MGILRFISRLRYFETYLGPYPKWRRPQIENRYQLFLYYDCLSLLNEALSNLTSLSET